MYLFLFSIYQKQKHFKEFLHKFKEQQANSSLILASVKITEGHDKLKNWNIVLWERAFVSEDLLQQG